MFGNDFDRVDGFLVAAVAEVALFSEEDGVGL